MAAQQMELFGYFVLLGLVSGAAYDGLRAIRGELRHAVAVVIAEDCVFIAAVLALSYGLFWRYNQGAIRIYGWIGLAASCGLYQLTLGRYLRRAMQKGLHLLLFPLRYLKKRLTNAYKKSKMKRKERRKARVILKQEKRKTKTQNRGVFRNHQTRKSGFPPNEKDHGL